MGYFGGIGAGRGWHKTHFLIEEWELRELLTLGSIVLVKTNGRVLADYVDTSRCEYIQSYAYYLQHLRSDATVRWTVTGPLHISLTTQLKAISEQGCPDAQFKLLQPAEPVIDLDALPILFADDRVLVNVMGKDQGFFGLSMHFPKVVSFGSEGHAILHPTEQYANSVLHLRLRSALMESTGPCTVVSKTKVQRTSVRISKSCKAWVNEHAYLLKHGLKVK